MLDLVTLWGIRNAISSPVSVSGPPPCAAPAGQTIPPSGPPHALANLSARQAKEMGLMTSGTYGRPSTTSSASAALVESLMSRLQARTALIGSTLYKLTWKQRALPSGRSIYALRASARPISDNAYTGWPTPLHTDGSKACNRYREDYQNGLGAIASLSGWATPTTRDYKNTGDLENYIYGSKTGRIRDDSTSTQAYLAGWRTPSASDGEGGVMEIRPESTGRYKLRDDVHLAGWPTPTKTDANRGSEYDCMAKNTTLNMAAVRALNSPARLTVNGEILIGSFAGMESGGQLDPAHSRWLMGLPHAWDDCAPMVTRLSNRSQKNS